MQTVVVDPTAAVAITSLPAPPAQSACCRCCAHNEDPVVELQDQALTEVDTLLAEARWQWIKEQVDRVRDLGVRQQAKLFFLSLLKATSLNDMDAVLTEMEAWREELKGKQVKRSRSESELVQTLFLLGLDKQMDLSRTG